MPYTAVEEIPNIEDELFKAGMYGSTRKAFASLRNRYCFLHTTKGILRGESLFNSELSDNLGIHIKKPTDPHEMFVDIMQLAFGKTNNGLKLFGRVARHKDPRLCAVGAKAFYLLYRFDVTGEFTDDCEVDFTDNKSWFDIKLLVDGQSSDFTKAIKNVTYSDAM